MSFQRRSDAQREFVWRHRLRLEPLELRNAPIALDLLAGLGGLSLADFGSSNLPAGPSEAGSSAALALVRSSDVPSGLDVALSELGVPAPIASAFADAQTAAGQANVQNQATDLGASTVAKLTPGQTDPVLALSFEATTATAAPGGLPVVPSGAAVASQPATGPNNASAPGQHLSLSVSSPPLLAGASASAVSAEQVALLVGAQSDATTATIPPAASEPQVAPDGFIAGQAGTLEPSVAQGTVLATPPVATAEQRAILENQAAVEPLPTPAIPIDPNGQPSNAPPTAPDLGSREPGDFAFYRRNVDTGTGGLSPTGSPEVASIGRAFFETGNFYGSVSGDYGSNFGYVNPYTLFPATGDFSGGFGGNARLATDLGRGMVMWQLEYVKTGSAANSTNGMRLAVANSATRLLDSSWTYYDLTPSFFSEGVGRWLNYAHLAVSNNYLYASSNEFLTTNNAYVRALLWRIPLSELQAGGTVHVTFWRVDNGSSLPLSSNATSTMYSASHINSTSMRVFNQPESSTNLNWNDRSGLAATNSGTHTSLFNGINWTARSDERIQTGVVFQTTVTFMWNSAQGSGRPQPFVRGATFLTTNFNLTLQPDLWFGSYAWHWAGLAGSDQAGFAGPVFVGGPGLAPQVNILMQDEFSNPTIPPPWTNYGAVAGNNASANWGDYVGAAIDQRYPHTWLGGGYIQNGASIVPYYFWFGRAGRDPHRLVPRAHAGETIATATDTGINQLGGFYDYSNELWSPAVARRDVGMYRVHAYAGTTLYALTSSLSYSGGDDVDTYMRLFNAGGTQLAFNDDISQSNLYSYLSYPITTTGDYYVGISGYPNSAYNPNVAGSGVPGAVGDYRMDILLLPNATRALRVTTTAANPDVAGTAFNVTVAALDSDHNVNPSYRGTVHFATLDPLATLPADYTFTAADNGIHTFTGVAFRREGVQVISVNDRMFLAGFSSPIVVIPAATTHFTVSGYPASATAGTPGYVLVTTYDAYGNLTPLYRGQVHFSSTDGQALLPFNYTFTAFDFGLHLFIATLTTAGTQSITVTDTADASITGTQSGIVINPAAATHFQVDAPSSVISGTAFDVTITALDRFGNTDTNYAGTVTFTTSDGDPGVVLPNDYPFAAGDNGVHTFSGGATLVTEGDQTITATDVDSGIAGTATVTVTTSELRNSPQLAALALASLPGQPAPTGPATPSDSPTAAEMLAPTPWDGGILPPTIAKTTTADYRRTNLPRATDLALLDEWFGQLA